MRFALAYLIPFLAALGIGMGGRWLLLAPLYVYVIHPALDSLMGARASSSAQASLQAKKLANLLLWLAPAAQAALLWFALSHTGRWGFFEWIGAVACVGTSGGAFGITAAHELIHRRNAWERALGVALLCLVGYAHFAIEHVLGHHMRVGTPEDPATARAGESVYAFWKRSIRDSAASAWRLEEPRGLAANRVFRFAAVEIVLLDLTSRIFGFGGLFFYLLQSLFAILLVETINYIEHYGLAREVAAGDEYEAVAERHSWDSPNALTNWSLFNLGLHSRHHLSPALPFTQLRESPSAPKLPYGYSAMLLLALCPPLWRSTMDPKLAAVSPPAVSSNP